MLTMRRFVMIILFTLVLWGVLQGGFPPKVNATGEFRVQDDVGYKINTLEFTRVRYVGECPGTRYLDDLKGEFSSETTPPGPGKRVIIRNVTPGINSDPYPYTDRDYSQNNYSESFVFGLNFRHQQRTFSVLEGENEFEYEIRQDQRLVEKGSFSAEVLVNDLGVYERRPICSQEMECDESCRDNDNRDRRERYCARVTRCSCPK